MQVKVIAYRYIPGSRMGDPGEEYRRTVAVLDEPDAQRLIKELRDSVLVGRGVPYPHDCPMVGNFRVLDDMIFSLEGLVNDPGKAEYERRKKEAEEASRVRLHAELDAEQANRPASGIVTRCSFSTGDC